MGNLRCRLSVVKFEGIQHFCVLFVYRSQTRRAGSVERRPPGDGLLDPRGGGAGPRDGGGFQSVRGSFSSQVFFFVYPVLDLGSLRCRLSVVKFEGIPHFCVLFVY